LRKVLSLLLLFIFVPAFSQFQEQGAIKGTVTDPEGAPLPGVTVTLTGSKTAPRTVVTSERGNFRFLSLPVASDYTVKFELTGFKGVIREKQVVSYGKDVVLDVTLTPTTIEESVTVIGQTPVIDTKKTQVGVNITSDMIMSLPTARNAWVMLTLVPGMLVAKEDVGGNEAGQQYGYTGHGSLDRDNTWNIDDINITDNSALGSAPAYLNVASYEEMQINYGNNDVKAQTGGVQLNFITKRGGNSLSGTFYLDAEDKNWQSSNVSAELKSFGYANPGVNKIYLYGANFGGPIVKDRAWFYGSWSIQDLDAINLSGTSDKTWLAEGYGKLNFQITSGTRAELFIEYNNKNKWGRQDVYEIAETSPDSVWDQDGPGYQYKAEIEQTSGNLYLNLKGIYAINTFYLHPRAAAKGIPWTVSYSPRFYVTGAMDDYGTERYNSEVVFNGNYFAEKILGGDHEIKFGADVMVSTVSSYDYYDSNVFRYYYGPDPTMPTGEYWEVEAKRDVNLKEWERRYSLFVQDTATYGKLSINLGLRYDNETSMVKDQKVPASPLLTQFLPALEIAKLDPGVSWSMLSPRISFIYDIFGTGKDVIKLTLARYGSQDGFGMASFLNPMGWAGIGVVWQDLNGDGKVQNDELFGKDENGNLVAPTTSTILWAWGVNVDNPTDITPANKIDPNNNAPLLDEISASYEKELFTDFRASLEFYYKRSHRDIWERPMSSDGTLETKDNYYIAGTEPITGYPIYGKYADFFYSYRTNYPNRYTDYMAGQLVLIKRLSNKWMLDASFTLTSWKLHYKGDYTDPETVAYFEGGSNSWLNSRWQLKCSGLYQFPLGINASWVFRAREGYVRGTYLRVDRPGMGMSTIYGLSTGGGKYGDTRLPNFYELDFRIEKVFQLSEKSKIVVAADAFNALNNAHVLSEQDLITSDIFGRTTKILNPRLFRFGVRFEF
jgi:hypothetical protein